MKELLEQYTRYNHWANARVIECVLDNALDQLDTEVKSSFTSLRKTLYHIWDAEKIWLKRFDSSSDNGNLWFSAAFTGTTEEAFEGLLEISAGHIAFVADHEDDFLKSICNYKNSKGDPFANSYCELVLHIMNHSNYHRGQVITLLREVGITIIPSTDFIGFLRNQTK